MYFSGYMEGCCGTDGLGNYLPEDAFHPPQLMASNYLDGYMGQETPWWASLITAGENVATQVIRSTQPTYTAPYNPYGTPPTYGTPGILPAGIYQPPTPPAPGAIFPTQTNYLPWILGAGVLLFVMNSGGGRRPAGRRARRRR